MYEMTIEEIHSLGLNEAFLKEMSLVNESNLDEAIECLENHIDSLQYEDGRKVRLERRQSMKKILRILYNFAFKKDGQCSPSMRTIACELDPNLEAIQPDDSLEAIKSKEKAMASKLMLVQRTIETLTRFGIIVVHTYRSDTNRNDNPEEANFRNPNFYYELVPVSIFCSAFKTLVKMCHVAVRKLGGIIRRVQESVAAVEKVTVKALGLHKRQKWEGHKYDGIDTGGIRFDSCVYE